MQTITATELARNTRARLDTDASRAETVAIERNHTMIAQILPPQRTMTASQALAGLVLPSLALAILTQAQANAWLKDSMDGFGDAVRDPWV